MTSRVRERPLDFADVAFAGAYALVFAAATLAGALDGPIRFVLAVPLLGFLPGYALVAALLPDAPDAESAVTDGFFERAALSVVPALLSDAPDAGPAVTDVGFFERAALSIAGSVVVLVVLGVALSSFAVPLTGPVVTVALVGVVVLGSLVAVARRCRRPPTARAAPPIERWVREVRAGTTGATPTDAAVNVALALAVLLAVSGLAFGLAAPQRGESYTQVSLLEPHGGSTVEANYTTNVSMGDPVNATLAVDNYEGHAQNYTAVVVLERLRRHGTTATVLQRSTLSRFHLRVPDGGRRTHAFSARPDTLGRDLRLDVLVYRGSAPETPLPATADWQLYVWMNVTSPVTVTSPSAAANGTTNGSVGTTNGTTTGGVGGASGTTAGVGGATRTPNGRVGAVNPTSTRAVR